MESDATPLAYSPEIKTIAPDEHVTFAEPSLPMQHIAWHMDTQYRHAYRPQHAKSHGLVVGTSAMLPNRTAQLAQEHSSQAGSHPVVTHPFVESRLRCIMRPYLKAYEEAPKYRVRRNERERAKPSSIAEVPT